ncbi:MAG: diacylglycerol kinase [Gemmatimonadaceae bacterium]|nr:diacylglycerol kinase [Gemmatimonadaceae bacterium]
MTRSDDGPRRIPVLINPRGGSADKVLELLRADSRFVVHETDPRVLTDRVRALVDEGVRRIAVSGGDGTVTAAAATRCGSDVELAGIPGGTLNHLARDNGIPVEPEQAAEIAATGTAHPIDVGRVNEHVFLNTSAVGAYVSFVRTRERLESWMPYWPASVLAGLQLLARMPRFAVHIDAAGDQPARSYQACLVFVSVGERDFDKGVFGARTTESRRGLHVIVVPNAGWRRLSRLVLGAVFRGMQAELGQVDSFVVDECRIEMRRRHGNVSFDGEIRALDAPLRYRIEHDRVRLVAPAPIGGERPPSAEAR